MSKSQNNRCSSLYNHLGFGVCLIKHIKKSEWHRLPSMIRRLKKAYRPMTKEKMLELSPPCNTTIGNNSSYLASKNRLSS